MSYESLRIDLEYITQNRPLPPGATMAQVLHRLDQLTRETSLPDRLKHYLSQRSYVKALAWLDDPTLPHHV